MSIALAVRNGERVSLGDVHFVPKTSVAKGDGLVVAYNTSAVVLESLTKEQALMEHRILKSEVELMLLAFPEFFEYIDQYPVVYSLNCYYGTGGVGILDESGGILCWYLNLT